MSLKLVHQRLEGVLNDTDFSVRNEKDSNGEVYAISVYSGGPKGITVRDKDGYYEVTGTDFDESEINKEFNSIGELANFVEANFT